MDITRAFARIAAAGFLPFVLSAVTLAQTAPFVTYTPAPPSHQGGSPPPAAIAKTMGDPEYATLYGGNAYDEMLAKVIGRNATCTVGVTSSTNLTLFSPFQMANAGGFDGWIGCGDLLTGIPLFASYLGDQDDETITGADIYRDTLFVVGVTTSMTMPGVDGSYQSVSGGGQDCFVSRMSAFDGSGLKTTFFGLDGDEYCSGIKVARQGVWIGGTTNKLIDLVNPIQEVAKGPSDAMIALLRRDLSSLRFATLIGGDDADGAERIGVKDYYDHKDEENGDGSNLARVFLTGWSRGPGAPVTENAHQKTHAGGVDAFVMSLSYDYEIDSPTLSYFSYAGRSGDEVPRDMSLSRRGISLTGWTTSVNWNNFGRGKNAGSSDGFYFEQPIPVDTTGPEIGYVGPSNSYNLPLAIATSRPGISVVAGYTTVPSSGNAFMQAYDRDYNTIGIQFAGGAAPADFNTVEVNPFFWAGGGKTAQAIPTTPLAIQSSYGGGDFDMFGSKYRTPWGYQTIYNLTLDDLTVQRNGHPLGTIGARLPGRVDALAWNVSYQYQLARGGQTYNIDRLLDETSDVLNYTYIFPDQALSVSVPRVDRREVGILGYNELGRAVDVVRFDQTVEHNEIRRTTVDAGQFFFIPLPRDQNVRITDGIEFIDYRPPKKAYRSDFPYLSGVLQPVAAAGKGAQNFELVLYDAEGSPVVLPVTTDVEGSETLPSRLALHPNHPNPFNQSTTIRFETSKTAAVRLTVFDIMGRHIRTLVDATQPAGTSSIEWDGRNEGGGRLSSGTYFVRLDVDGYTTVRSVVLAR